MKTIAKKRLYTVGTIIIGCGIGAAFAGCGASNTDSATQTQETVDSSAATSESSAKALKNISIEVVDKDGNKKEYKEETDAEFLKGAMDELAEDGDFSYSGNDSGYGIMVDHINGQRADYTQDGAYWAIYVNDAYGNNGIETQTVTDGDTYSFRYESAS